MELSDPENETKIGYKVLKTLGVLEREIHRHWIHVDWK